jgi:hypothetical protein
LTHRITDAGEQASWVVIDATGSGMSLTTARQGLKKAVSDAEAGANLDEVFVLLSPTSVLLWKRG